MSYEDFVGFVKAQPADRVIDHTSWQSCAIGDYVAGSDQEQDRETESFCDAAYSASDLILEANDDLYQNLNCHGEVYDEEHGHRTIETYGDLQSYLNGTF